MPDAKETLPRWKALGLPEDVTIPNPWAHIAGHLPAGTVDAPAPDPKPSPNADRIVAMV